VRESAITTTTLDEVDPSRGRGELVALAADDGARLWTRRFPSASFGCATVANDVVFAQTFDGSAYALAADDGRVLWHARLRARSNSCPAVVGDTVLLGAGVPRRGSTEELVAFAPH
jgi:outer membrane protein assembly factor BamB